MDNQKCSYLETVSCRSDVAVCVLSMLSVFFTTGSLFLSFLYFLVQTNFSSYNCTLWLEQIYFKKSMFDIWAAELHLKVVQRRVNFVWAIMTDLECYSSLFSLPLVENMYYRDWREQVTVRSVPKNLLSIAVSLLLKRCKGTHETSNLFLSLELCYNNLTG